MIKELQFATAQLRAAYTALMEGRVTDQKQFAEGLIAPQIERLERFLDQQIGAEK